MAAAVVSPGCSCAGPPVLAPTLVGAGGEGGGSSGAGEGGEGGDATGSGAGAGGFGGWGGGSPRGIAAGEVVSAGRLMKSRNYSMVFTLGQPSQNQGKTTSPKYRMQGGLVGANGSLR